MGRGTCGDKAGWKFDMLVSCLSQPDQHSQFSFESGIMQAFLPRT